MNKGSRDTGEGSPREHLTGKVEEEAKRLDTLENEGGMALLETGKAGLETCMGNKIVILQVYI